MFRDPCIGLRAGPVVDGDVMAGGGQMPCDRGAHRAQPEEGDFSHVASHKMDFRHALGSEPD